MEHQPFETWILEETPRSAEQERQLQEHLQTCSACRSLQQRWQSASAEIRGATAASPQPGFSARFQAGLAERRAHHYTLQVRRALLYSVSSAAALIAAFMIYILWNASPVNLIVNLTEAALRGAATLNGLDRVFQSSMQSVPLPIPLAIWMLLSTGFAVLVLGWLFAIWQITTQGGKNR